MTAQLYVSISYSDDVNLMSTSLHSGNSARALKHTFCACIITWRWHLLGVIAKPERTVTVMYLNAKSGMQINRCLLMVK